MSKQEARKLTPHAAAIYFGCSPRLLQRLRTLGWITAIEDTHRKARTPKFKDTHYFQWQLEDLANDYISSLSIYDLIAIRMDNRSSQIVSAYRGVPKLVIKRIREDAALCGIIDSFITDEMRAQSRDLQSLAKEIRAKGFDSAAAQGRRAEAMMPADERKWRNSGNRAITITNIHCREIYGPGSITDALKNPEG